MRIPTSILGLFMPLGCMSVCFASSMLLAQAAPSTVSADRAVGYVWPVIGQPGEEKSRRDYNC
jgi:hypothetical protein